MAIQRQNFVFIFDFKSVKWELHSYKLGMARMVCNGLQWAFSILKFGVAFKAVSEFLDYNLV